MTPTHSAIALASLLAASSAPARAQGTSPLPFAIVTRDADVVVTRDVPYAMHDSGRLAMDVYRPASAATSRLPAIIFFNRATGADRSNAFYAQWARVAAARGLVAILPDLRDRSEGADFAQLAAHLRQRAGDLGIDRDAVAVYAASGNVWAALPAIEDPAQTLVKAAVIYYGGADINEFRPDIPLLLVRAGLDRPGMNNALWSVATKAIAQNVPVTLLNNAGGLHGFETRNVDDASRDAMERSIDWVKRMLAPGYQAAMRQGVAEATAAGLALSGRAAEAATRYAELVRARPDDHPLRLSYGEALLADRQFAAACAVFEPLKGKGLGPRDLGLPAARACLGSGDADAAIAWLRTIPSRYLPASVQQDDAFAALRDRADFRALFSGR